MKDIGQMQNKYVKDYYRILKSIFPLKTFYEGKFLKEFKMSLIEYSIEHPHCTFNDLIEEFGTPQEILLEYMNAQDYTETVKDIKKQTSKKIFLTFIFILFLLSITIYTFFLFNLKKEVEKAIPTSIDTIIYEEEIIK